MNQIRITTALLIGIFGTFSASAHAQQIAMRDARDGRAIPTSVVPSPTVAIAMHTTRAPVVDGREDDAIWATAHVIEGFRVFDPVEDGDPRFETTARVAYDERNLYVIVRAYDPHPDSIVARLARRDVRTTSDEIKLLIDSYHDRRSGFEFAVNPAGVKRDIAIINDSEEDISWDAVWDASARTDSLGWVAEFRIPFSQLRFAAGDSHTFGFAISREVARYSERYSWPLYRRSRSGIASQFGDLTGLTGISSPRRLEVSPYTVGRTANVPSGMAYDQRSQATMGADIKYGLTSNLTLDATVNPDFGQVEADPSVLNLSAFETFFPEKRPFFLEGQGLFRFDMSCNDGSCSGLFYSRRIGRSPQLGGDYFYDGNVNQSTILGAAKLTGRLGNGMSVGLMNATTQREVAAGCVADGSACAQGETIEPQTNYFVGRLQQELRGGQSVLGIMATNVRRNLDEWTSAHLRRDASVVGVDTRHQFFQRRYAISANVASSTVRGTPEAIAQTQLSGVHNFQRPDDDIVYDPTRTSMRGTTYMVSVQKTGGGIFRFESGYQYVSPGFESNDVGFLGRANAQNQFNWYAIQLRTPTKLYRQWMTNFNQWTNWTSDGMRQELGGNVNSHMQFTNNWWVHWGQGGNALAPSLCDNCSRGGPALRQSRALWGWAGIEGDNRRSIVPYFFSQWINGDEGRSHSLRFDPSLTVKASSRLSADLGMGISRDVNDAQWYGNYGDVGADTTHYTFAHLEQHTVSVTARVNFTATPTLSLQIYAQPFITGGDYSNWRELDDPRAMSFQSRYQPYNGGTLDDFNFRQLRSNTVVRWEYRPGSALYFVWAQERTSFDAQPFSARDDYNRLFGSHPGNVFLIKGSYWLSL
jgi:hypothetical protein